MKCVFTLLLFMLSLSRLFAQQPGTLDLSFGTRGVEVTPLTSYYSNEQVAAGMDGRLFVGTIGAYKGFTHTFRVDAVLPDGSADSSFGEEGSAYVLFPGMTDTFNTGNEATIIALAVQPDGKILTCGSLTYSNGFFDSRVAIARFLPGGSPDSSFGKNGADTLTFDTNLSSATAVGLLPDGKFIIGGGLSDEDGLSHFFTARFLQNGALDVTYGKQGLTLSGNTGGASAVAVQKDGRIVAAGYSGKSAGTTRFQLERYLPDGNPDVSFGNQGLVMTTVSTGFATISDVAMQGDKIVVTGYSKNPLQLTTVRYNADGSLDAGFGEGGIVKTALPKFGGSGLGYKVFVTGEKDDKILATACNCEFVMGYGDYVVAAYRNDGSPDSSFGNNGLAVTDVEEGDYTSGGTMQKDGKVVVIGYSSNLEIYEPNRVLARYYGYPQKAALYVRVKRWLQNHTLTWTGLPVASNIEYYNLEQSANGTTGFAQIARLNGGNHLKEYSFTNSRLLEGTNYYRVKAVSVGGVVYYSEVVSADNGVCTASVYPNPAKSYLIVKGLSADEKTTLRIADAAGNVKASAVSNGTQYRFQVANLHPGTYYLHTAAGNKTEMISFVKE